MNLVDFFKLEFQYLFKKFSIENPNETIIQHPSKFYLNSQDQFFGGKDWQNYESDISNVSIEKREDFILCLFAALTVDYYYTNNYNNAFLENRVPIPKFGWCGYGPHFEHPLIILRKHFGNDISEIIISKRKEEIIDLLTNLIHNYTNENARGFSELIKNNITNIPSQFNDSVYFEFLNETELECWKKHMTLIF